MGEWWEMRSELRPGSGGREEGRLCRSPRALVWTLAFTVTEMTEPLEGFEQRSDENKTAF